MEEELAAARERIAELTEALAALVADSDAAGEDGDWEHLNNDEHWDAARAALASAARLLTQGKAG
jgi:hypothetical protein